MLLIHFLSKLFMESSNYNSCTTYLRFNFDIEDCIQDRVGRVYNPGKFSCKSPKLKQKDYYYLQMHKVQIFCECQKNLTHLPLIILCFTKVLKCLNQSYKKASIETAVDPACRFHGFETIFPTSKLCKTLI